MQTSFKSATGDLWSLNTFLFPEKFSVRASLGFAKRDSLSLSLSLSIISLIHHRKRDMGSSYFGEPNMGNERGSGSSSSSRKSKKNNSDKPKQPQRGLGVAQLEKIRLHGQMGCATYHPSLHGPYPTNFNNVIIIYISLSCLIALTTMVVYWSLFGSVRIFYLWSYGFVDHAARGYENAICNLFFNTIIIIFFLFILIIIILNFLWFPPQHHGMCNSCF